MKHTGPSAKNLPLDPLIVLLTQKRLHLIIMIAVSRIQSGNIILGSLCSFFISGDSA